MGARTLPGTLAVVAALLSACTHVPVAPRAIQNRADTPLSTYFPLGEGTAWSYDVLDVPSGEHILAVNRVQARMGNRAMVFTGPDPLSYEDRGDRIVRLPSGATVLQAPIVKEAGWAIPDGYARIIAVDAVAATPAGSWKHCVAVEEATAERRVVTTYAPEVGPAQVEIYSRGPAGEALVSRALLRGYHAAGRPLGE
jgi:hypothetical protein